MIPDLTIKKGDAGKVISGQFKDANGVVVNCTGSTSRKIFMRPISGGTLKINSTFTFTTEATGIWSYTMLAANVDTSGTFLLEFEVTLSGPQTVTFPTDPDAPYMIVKIQDDLG